MALLGLVIPENVSDLLKAVDVPGDREPSDHLTMFYFEQDLTMSDIMKICKTVSPIVEKYSTFKLSIDKISCFPKGPDGVPIKGDVNSKDLIKLRKEIAKAFDKNKIKFSKRHPDFNPHVTLSYSDDDTDDVKLKEPIVWMVNKLVLWGGDSDTDGINVDIPLGGKISKAHIIYALSNKFKNTLKI